jgi:hypothetical protein
MEPPVDMPPEEPTQADPNDERPVDALNLLPLLIRADKDWVKEQAKEKVKAAVDDDDSRKDYMLRYADMLKLYAGVVANLGYPAEGAKAPSIAIVTKAALHLWALVYDQVVPAKGDIVKSRALGPQDRPRALRTERHMNWQLRYRMPDWGTSQMFSIMAWLFGSAFRYYRWDPIEHTHVIEALPIDDVIVSYTETDRHPQMKNVERVTVIRRLARWELERYQDEGFYSNIEAIFPKPGDESSSSSDGDTNPMVNSDPSPVRDAANQIQGIEPPTKKSKLSKRELYEQHGWTKFPSKLGDEDTGLEGQTLPTVWTIDKQTKEPVAVTLRQEPDSVDQARYNDEAKAHGIGAKTAAAQGMPAPSGPRPVRMRTVYRVIHIGCFPNPDGFYRLGPISLLASSNELANSLAAEYMLGAKFHNMFTGWMAKGTRNKHGDAQMVHGKIMETELEPEQLNSAIKILETRPPSDGLWKLIEKLEKNSELTAAASILSGEKGQSGGTAKEAMIRNTNAQTLISVMTRVYLDGISYELKLIAHGNSINLDEYEYFPFTVDSPDQPGESEVVREKVYRADYVEDMHIEFTADARMTSKAERVADAKDYVSLILDSPLAQNAPLVHFAFKEMFITGEATQYITAMGKPPEPEKPPEPMSQEDENAGFLNESLHPVLPEDAHDEHLIKIQEFKASPFAQKLTSTGKQMLDKHERAHVAELYKQVAATQGVQNGGPDPGGDLGIGGGPDGPEGGPGLGAPPQGGMEESQNGIPLGPA